MNNLFVLIMWSLFPLLIVIALAGQWLVNTIREDMRLFRRALRGTVVLAPFLPFLYRFSVEGKQYSEIRVIDATRKACVSQSIYKTRSSGSRLPASVQSLVGVPTVTLGNFADWDELEGEINATLPGILEEQLKANPLPQTLSQERIEQVEKNRERENTPNVGGVPITSTVPAEMKARKQAFGRAMTRAFNLKAGSIVAQTLREYADVQEYLTEKESEAIQGWLSGSRFDTTKPEGEAQRAALRAWLYPYRRQGGLPKSFDKWADLIEVAQNPYDVGHVPEVEEQDDHASQDEQDDLQNLRDELSALAGMVAQLAQKLA